jgi:hypothetical protein
MKDVEGVDDLSKDVYGIDCPFLGNLLQEQERSSALYVTPRSLLDYWHGTRDQPESGASGLKSSF